MLSFYFIIAFLLGIGLYLNRNKVITMGLLGTFAIVQWVLTIYACFNFRSTELNYFTYDSLSVLLLLALSIITIPALIHSFIYIEKHDNIAEQKSIYYTATIILLTSISAGYMANHIAVTWIFTELTTLCASALIYHHRNKLALEGTWKYVFICAISITFVFIGILFLSLSLEHAGSDNLTYPNLVLNSSKLNPFWLRLAFLFIFTGFTAKLGLVPMFTAGVDAKDKAPSASAALFSSVLVNLGFTGIFRFYIILANTSLHQWSNIIIGIAALLSIFVATVYMLKVKNLKRMLAYSGIEHMGLVMLGIAAGGIGYYAAILHLILHGLIKSALFFQFSQLFRIYQTKNIYQIGNYFKYNTAGALVLLFGFISITAMPPSGMFISEFLIFRSLFESHHFIILTVVLLLLTIIIWSFGKNMFKIIFLPPIDFDVTQIPKIKPLESLSQFLLIAFAVYLGFHPPAEFVDLINESIILLPH